MKNESYGIRIGGRQKSRIDFPDELKKKILAFFIVESEMRKAEAAKAKILKIKPASKGESRKSQFNSEMVVLLIDWIYKRRSACYSDF